MSTLKKNIRIQSGFTLIEMAAVIMILGIIVAAFSPLYKLHLENKARQETQASVDDISAAIGAFRAVNGRYPCPASLIATRNDLNYGREDCTNYNGVINPGTCDDGAGGSGICREQSERVISYMDPFTAGTPTVNANPTVRVGMIPFKELNISEDLAYDGYDNRITYAVTENLMFDTTFRGNQGGIEIFNNAAVPASILNPPASAHFLVFSYGKNGNGAYTRNGVRIACPVGGVEAANCDVALNARYTLAQVNSTFGVNEYDDVMTYFTQSEVPLWQLSTQQQGAILQKPDGDVGMIFSTTNNPFAAMTSATTQAADIDGILRADDDPSDAPVQGNIMANSLCDSGGLAGGDCFGTEVIEGTVNISGGVNIGGGMKCPEDDTFDDNGDGTPETGQYIVGVRRGAPICQDDTTIRCGTNQIMTGIDPNGRVLCSSNSSCPTGSTSLCGNTYTLAAGIHGTVRSTGRSGLTAYRNFVCNNTSWILQSSGGVCTCTPQTQRTQTAACGPGFTGNFQQTSDYICPTTSSPLGTNPYWTAWAPPAWTGSGASWTYPAGSPCNCVGTTEYRNTTCPAGQVPSISQQSRTFTCSSSLGGSWSAWGPAYTCSCVMQAPQEQWVACGGNSPVGAMKKQRRTFISCPNNWTAWADVDTSACTCTPWSETRTNDPCPAGQMGSVTNRYDYGCPSGVTITQLSSTCAPPPPVVCSWASSDFVGSSTTAAGPRIGTSGSPACTCGETRPQCHSGSTGNFQIYQNCVCGS